MKILTITLLTLLHAATLNAEIIVSDAWVKKTLGGVKNTVAFMKFTNTGDKDVDILSASSPIASSTQFHLMKHEGGMMHMSPVKLITVLANSHVELNPAGLHIMMMGLKSDLTIGQQLSIEFKLEGGATLKKTLVVRAQGY